MKKSEDSPRQKQIKFRRKAVTILRRLGYCLTVSAFVLIFSLVSRSDYEIFEEGEKVIYFFREFIIYLLVLAIGWSMVEVPTKIWFPDEDEEK